MPVNENLAQYSDFAFKSAFVIFVLAELLILASYASMRTKAVTAKDSARELVGVAAGQGDAVLPGDAAGPGADPDEASGARGSARPLQERLANMGYSLVVLGFLLHVASLVLRGFAVERMPLGNMYEFVSTACAVGVGVGLVTLRPQTKRPLLAFVLVPVVILMFVAGTVLYATAAPVVPALQSYWLPIHVTIICIGSGIFLVSGVASMLFLFRIRFPKGEEKDTRLGRFAAKLPDAQYLDRLAYKTVVFGFPVFGIGVICGAIWAEAAWGRFWGWDPKETVSFIAWIVYAAYLHARATAGWRDTKAAWINLAGFVAMLFNLFIINMVVSGLHSYAGLT
ncbi:c-type cytochrome biogenesis protein CcsB [Tomitella fengzijianii]|uniref:C-type cytochrome biogenesis protein CcsB n=1 Tax=Tomitella fengzijianii TaxID=2597660 RepID=A0A516X0D5_9ACTN|nr:c-type cytochrome biogenesis protein CcsB [Tomitella fengzijianii]QDQ96513.1 c-type cytochrome biogenesis protein CcsB [Tomitella fengzijianii]